MDAETWIWLLLPLFLGLFAAVAGAVYAERKDRHAISDHEQRLRNLEDCEAHRKGAESVGGPEPVSGSDFDLAAQVVKNAQSIGGMEERLKALEEA